MSLKGKIISVSDNKEKAKVLVTPIANCNGCKACAGLIKSSNVAQSEFEIEVLTNNNIVKPGDSVLIEMSEYQGTRAAFLIYGVPILGFLFGMLITPFICSLLNIVLNDLIRIICSFICLFISFLIIYFFLKRNNSDSFTMLISKKFSE